MRRSYLHTLQLLSRDARLYLVTSALIGFTVFGGISSVLLNLYLLRLGYSAPFVGLVNSVNLLSLAVFCLPAGMLAGRWGIRRTMIVGLSLMVLGNGLFPLAEFIPGALRSAWLLATIMLGGTGFALYIVNGAPFLAAATGDEERGHAFAAQAALWPLAGFLGSFIGGLLPDGFASLLGLSVADPAPYRYPLLLSAAMLVPAVLAVVATREPRLPAATPSDDARGAPIGMIVLLSLVVLLQVSGEGTARTFFNVYLDVALRVPTTHIGGLAAVGQLVAAFAALAAPVLASRWGGPRTYFAGSLCLAGSLLPLAYIQDWRAAALSFTAAIAFVSVTRPVFIVFQMEQVPMRWRATMAAAGTMAFGLSTSAVAFGGGYVIAAMGYRELFLLGAATTTAGALLFWAAFVRASAPRSSAPEAQPALGNSVLEPNS